MNARIGLGGHYADPLLSGGYMCTRRGGESPVWRPDRETADQLLLEWARQEWPAAVSVECTAGCGAKFSVPPGSPPRRCYWCARGITVEHVAGTCHLHPVEMAAPPALVPAGTSG